MNRKVKVFFFIDSFRIGGMHRQVYYLVKNLNRDRFIPVLVTQSQYGGLREDFLALDLKTYDLGWQGRMSFLKILYRFINVLRDEKPDVIFLTQLPNFIYFLLARLFYFERLFLVGSFRALNFWIGNKGRIHLFVERLFVKLYYGACNFITANSKALTIHYESLLEIRSVKPIELVYNGLTLDFVNAGLVRRDLFNARTEDVVVVMVARLDPMKDFDTLLHAAKRLVEFSDNIKVYLIGDGELRELICSKINFLGLQETVFLLGELTNPYPYLMSADISILSTKGEGLSNTLLESMFLGIPCIASSVGGNIELLENGRGVLVRPGDVQELFRSILALSSNYELRQTLSMEAKKYVVQNFSIGSMVRAYEEIFSRVRNAGDYFES
jgi:glycosyltransferase involved in cell wall biosynthesis